MDVAPRVDRLFARAVDEQLQEQRLIRDALEDFAERLARVEATAAALEDKIGPWSDPGAATPDLAVRVEERIGKRLDKFDARLDGMSEAIERRAVATMSDELEGIAEELRRAVGELGRLLVRDRRRIDKILTEHRNAILAELRMPAANGRRRTLDLRDDELDDIEEYEDEIDELDDNDVEIERPPVRPRPRLRRLR